MKEVSDPIEIPKTTITLSPIRPIGKRWKQVKDGTHPNKHKDFIQSKMTSYQLVLQKVKELYLMPGEVYFERDYTNDNSEPFKIYSFITQTFYWYIECTLNFEIVINYDFNNCIHEQQIQALLHNHILAYYATRTPMNIGQYLAGVVAYQDPKYIHRKT